MSQVRILPGPPFPCTDGAIAAALAAGRSGRRQARRDPALNVGHDRLLAEIGEKVVEMAVIELQRLVAGAGAVDNSWLPAGIVALSRVSWRMSTGRVMRGNLRLRRSSPRTMAAKVIAGWV